MQTLTVDANAPPKAGHGLGEGGDGDAEDDLEDNAESKVEVTSIVAGVYEDARRLSEALGERKRRWLRNDETTPISRTELLGKAFKAVGLDRDGWGAHGGRYRSVMRELDQSQRKLGPRKDARASEVLWRVSDLGSAHAGLRCIAAAGSSGSHPYRLFACGRRIHLIDYQRLENPNLTDDQTGMHLPSHAAGNAFFHLFAQCWLRALVWSLLPL